MQEHFHIKKATLFIFAAAFFLSITAFFIKLSSAHTTTSMIIFFRFAVSFIYILSILGIKKLKGNPLPLTTKHPFLHLLRAIFSLTTTLLFYYSLAFIPLVESNLLVMTVPLFVPLLSLLFFHKKTSMSHWFAVILGFIGIVFIFKPGHELFNPYSFFALGAALSGAFAILTIRKLSKRENPYLSMFHYFSLAFIITGTLSLFKWQTPDIYVTLLLIGAGIFGTLYQECLIRGSTHAPANITSALLYFSLIPSFMFGWLIWREIPNLTTWVGIILVCLSNVLIVKHAKK